MKTRQLSKEKAISTKTEALLKLQLTEAMRLIRELQRSNAELMRQNVSIMQINSNTLLGNRNNIHTNEEDRFINDVLSLITDNSPEINDNNLPGTDNFPSTNDNNSSVNDNCPGINDNSASVTDNNSFINDKRRKKKDNNASVSDKSKSLNDNKAHEVDNNNDFIEIDGKMFDKKILLEKLRYQINFMEKQSYDDVEIIKIWRERFKQSKIFCNKNIENHRRKVPASYLVDKPDLKNELVYQIEFDKIYNAFKMLNKGKKKNMPALKRQVNMLISLYSVIGCKPQELFSTCGLTAISGFRYAAKLRDFGFVQCSGRGTGGSYSITRKGEKFLVEASKANCWQIHSGR